MKCFSCGAAMPEGASFCPKCGTRQGLPGTPAPPAAQEPEAPVWRGRYSPFADALSWLLWALFAGAMAFIAFRYLTFSERWMYWVYWGAVFLPVVVIGSTSFIRRISTSYRLTSHRIFKEVGIVSRKISEVELIRVDDLSVSQNLIQRFFDVGVVTLLTTDASDPKLVLAGIRRPVEVKEHIRTHVQKRRSRTINLESL